MHIHVLDVADALAYRVVRLIEFLIETMECAHLIAGRPETLQMRHLIEAEALVLDGDDQAAVGEALAHIMNCKLRVE